MGSALIILLVAKRPTKRLGPALQGFSLRNSAPLGPYSRICQSPYGGPSGGEAVSHEPGTPAWFMLVGDISFWFRFLGYGLCPPPSPRGHRYLRGNGPSKRFWYKSYPLLWIPTAILSIDMDFNRNLTRISERKKDQLLRSGCRTSLQTPATCVPSSPNLKRIQLHHKKHNTQGGSI